jgi:hypothetical protein
MGVGRFVARAISGVVALGVLAVMLTVGIPLLLLAIAGVVGIVALMTVGLPAVIIGVLAVMAVAAVVILAVSGVQLGILALKVLLFVMLLSWLFRKLFVRSGVRETALVGPPVADIAAPRRDKYQVAAERELDEELGL